MLPKPRTLPIAALLATGAIVACQSEQRSPTRQETYSTERPFNEPVALIVLERNGVPDMSISGSAFLVDKQRGVFATARHVIDLAADYKLFFCGRVYRGHRLITPTITDVALFQIDGTFDPQTFPEPYGIAEKATLGEAVFIRGIHPHPRSVSDGLKHLVITGYYQWSHSQREYTYDDLPGKVTKLAVYVPNSAMRDLKDISLKDVVKVNLEVKADTDHSPSTRSFAGLSGGPTVNAQGQVLGVNSNEQGDEGGHVLDETGLNYKPRVTLRLVPFTEVRRMLEYLPSASR